MWEQIISIFPSSVNSSICEDVMKLSPLIKFMKLLIKLFQDGNDNTKGLKYKTSIKNDIMV